MSTKITDILYYLIWGTTIYTLVLAWLTNKKYRELRAIKKRIGVLCELDELAAVITHLGLKAYLYKGNYQDKYNFVSALQQYDRIYKYYKNLPELKVRHRDEG
jgi:hypothetical protein